MMIMIMIIIIIMMIIVILIVAIMMIIIMILSKNRYDIIFDRGSRLEAIGWDSIRLKKQVGI